MIPQSPQTLKDRLTELGIYTLRVDIQAEIVAKLHAGGVTAESVVRLVNAAKKTHTTGTMAIKTVCRLLRQSIGDIQEAIRQIRDTGGTATHYWGFPSPYPGCACDGCEGRRRQGASDWGVAPEPAVR